MSDSLRGGELGIVDIDISSQIIYDCLDTFKGRAHEVLGLDVILGEIL